MLTDDQRVHVASGQPLTLTFEQHTGGRELRFTLSASERAAHAATLPTRTRPHAPRFDANPPTEPAAHVAGVDAVGVQPESLVSSACSAESFGRASRVHRRTIESSVARARKPRLGSPGAHVAVDPQWKAAMAAATDGTMDRLGLNPSGAAHSCRLCGAALEIAAHPARYGVHPMDALQAVRIYYAN